MVYNRIKTQITDFMGEVFEKLCIEYMWSIYTQLPFTVQNINRWWGNNPDLKSQTELDLIAYGNDGEQAIIGELHINLLAYKIYLHAIYHIMVHYMNH